jgi:hypothetical protein
MIVVGNEPEGKPGKTAPPGLKVVTCNRDKDLPRLTSDVQRKADRIWRRVLLCYMGTEFLFYYARDLVPEQDKNSDLVLQLKAYLYRKFRTGKTHFLFRHAYVSICDIVNYF